jgi:putative heme-binding domain-containing protein
VATVATNAAHADAARALALVIPQLATADPALLRAALEGLVRGWPSGAPSPVAVTPGVEAALRSAAARLDVAGRAALLLVAERLGRLDLFPDEIARVRAELATQLAASGATAAARAAAGRRLLALAPASEAVPLVAAQLSPLAEPELVKELLAALGEAAGSDSPGGADVGVLLGDAVARRAPQLSAATLPSAVELLLRRPGWTRSLLALLAAGKLDAKALAPDVLDRLRKSGDAEIAATAESIAQSLGRPRNADRAKVVDAFLRLAAPDAKPGDPKRGAAVFAAQCAKCHTLRGHADFVGKVGPDLTGIGKRGRTELLIEILDPNRSVEGTYRAWSVTTKAGDDFVGRMVDEGRATLELLDAAAARHVIARDDVALLKPLARSLMPEELEQIGESDLAALLQFLVDD